LENEALSAGRRGEGADKSLFLLGLLSMLDPLNPWVEIGIILEIFDRRRVNERDDS
jgi:hypothetical protein